MPIAHADSSTPNIESIEAPAPKLDVYVTTDSGLQYKDTKIGEGATPLPGDTVRVHYTGWLASK